MGQPLSFMVPLLLILAVVVFAAVLIASFSRRRPHGHRSGRRGPEAGSSEPVSFSTDQLSVAQEHGHGSVGHSHPSGSQTHHHVGHDSGWSSTDSTGTSGGSWDSGSSDASGSDGGSSDSGGSDGGSSTSD